MHNIQQMIDSTKLDMNIAQVKAFFLGVLSAERPLSFSKALDEILDQTPEAKATLENPFHKIWLELNENYKNEIEKVVLVQNDSLENLKDQIDFFLTGMSLSGTSLDNCQNDKLLFFLNELEDLVEDLDDYLADTQADNEEGEELKDYLMDLWKNFSVSLSNKI